MNQNPILRTYTSPFGAYPFDEIKIDDYREAFAIAIAEKTAEIDKIINNEEEATFENTILALELCGSSLEKVCGVFFNLLHSESNDELMKISEEVIPQLSEMSTAIILSKPLFERIQKVYEQKDSLSLDEEEARILKNCYEGFAESGALLNDEDKKRLEELSISLSQHSLLYGQNTLKDQKRFRLYISNEADVQGMPETALVMAKELAEKEGKTEGWMFDLSAPSYFPFMQYCPNSELRKQMYLAKMSVGAGGDEFNNKEHIRALVNGRLEEARLLGYPTFAHYALHKRMAKTPEKVYELLDKLLSAYKGRGEEEIAEILEFARTKGFEAEEMKIWDWSYWAERYMKEYYDLDDEMLRPYFELSKVKEAVLGLATKLYGISFNRREDIPVYHQDVDILEVLDEEGEYLGLLYLDFFPRDGKQSGAWMNNFQDQYMESGKDHRPHIVLVMNFTTPTKDKPALLTAGEVNTFLHEFGHSLHGMFSRCRFSSLSGTSVARDFVELPSQLMENWLGQEEWLRSFAVHYQTGEPLPQEYIDRMKRAKYFLTAYACCRQLSFGYLDMAWHTIEEPLKDDEDLKYFEDKAWEQALLLGKSPEGTMMSTSFGHIFSGGYSAGYYGYKWAEVLDADAFSVFKEKGIFNKDVADKFRREILEQGDKRDAMDLYLSFRGQEPSIDALLRRDGILKDKD